MNFHIEQKFYFALQYNLVVLGREVKFIEGLWCVGS